jgi:hypothetical protein
MCESVEWVLLESPGYDDDVHDFHLLKTFSPSFAFVLTDFQYFYSLVVRGYSCVFGLFIDCDESFCLLPQPLTRICLYKIRLDYEKGNTFNASFREKLLSQLGQGNGLTAK